MKLFYKLEHRLTGKAYSTKEFGLHLFEFEKQAQRFKEENNLNMYEIKRYRKC